MKGSPIYRFVFAGGGTGGHLYPAIAVAEKIKELKPESEILFIGTKNKIESKVVPASGFNFVSIWISGFSRQLNLSNILFPLKVFVSYFQSLVALIKFKPRVAIGTGAYVAGPVISAASTLGTKIILLEQNSYPGVTNRLLEKKANQIHISYEDSKKYFRQSEKLVVTGNPIRPKLKLIDRVEAVKQLNLDASKKVLLIIGGSGGAGSINKAIANNIQSFVANDIQIIWQTGKNYYEDYLNYNSNSIKAMPYIDDMSSAYSCADLIIARAGATTIAELSYLGLPVILVPSPNVAANHQFKNAESLVKENAAELIEDGKINSDLFEKVNSIINDSTKLDLMKKNILKFSKPDAAKVVAENAINLAEQL
ncbi:MAG: undecaprenyldiphospho-muramoylpentapeptide beta-N-acetylglucosaminyltransferase [Ignavibacteriales bacterium]|jgi:UDP-N-acetylglucosamine--N-acetylmuramyl-(pentapeptide) pyrophosphoryl-undecaprenol N-acetylglucosamine transferase|nr:MAG: undecaprenyldiphospho-muramoylpentapeptide beta-N-acetylglucosaminyltransferase [Ignavibacteriales bacterium]